MAKKKAKRSASKKTARAVRKTVRKTTRKAATKRKAAKPARSTKKSTKKVATPASLKKAVNDLEAAMERHVNAVVRYAARHPKMLSSVEKPLLRMEKRVLDLKERMKRL